MLIDTVGGLNSTGAYYNNDGVDQDGRRILDTNLDLRSFLHNSTHLFLASSFSPIGSIAPSLKRGQTYLNLQIFCFWKYNKKPIAALTQLSRASRVIRYLTLHWASAVMKFSCGNMSLLWSSGCRFHAERMRSENGDTDCLIKGEFNKGIGVTNEDTGLNFVNCMNREIFHANTVLIS